MKTPNKQLDPIALAEQLQPQIEAADVKFVEYINKVQELTKEYGFDGLLISVGFAPKASDGTPVFLALAAHRDTFGPQELSALMDSAVRLSDQALHGYGDVPSPETIAFKKPIGNA